MHIRDATAADLPQITEIYNSIVLSSTAIYNDKPATIDERTAWWRARVERGFPVLVAHENDTVLGFASFGDFRSWPGYRLTVEGTVHIRDGVRSRGIGSQLLAELITRARAAGMHVMVAGVDSQNQASLRFLERHGFVRRGHLAEVGFKFGRYLNLTLLHFWLTPPADAPSLAEPPATDKT